MATVKGVLSELTTALRGQHLSASADPRRLNPPCVWLSAASVEHNLLGGGGTVRVDLYLIAPDHGVDQALDHLDSMLTKVLKVVDPATETSLNEAVTLPTGGGPMPAFRVTTDIETC